jgi:GTPase SAR1 family protein
MNIMEKHCSDNLCKILVGNKCDLEAKITKEQCLEYAERYNMQYIETSAKEDINVELAFETAISTIIQYWKDIGPSYTTQGMKLNPQIPQGNFACKC